MAPDRTIASHSLLTSEPYNLDSVLQATASTSYGSSNSTSASAFTSNSSKKPVNVLSRNQACRTCRSRKVKCDAVKPACGACLKSATAQGRPLTEVNCEYDDETTVTRKATRRATSDSNSLPTNQASSNSNGHKHSKTPARTTTTTTSSSSSSSSQHGNGLRPEKYVRMSDNGMASIERSLRLEAESKAKSNGASNTSANGHYSRRPSPYSGPPSNEYLNTMQQMEPNLVVNQGRPTGDSYPFSGMDWVGASSGLATYPAFSTEPQQQQPQNQAGTSSMTSFDNGPDSLYGLPVPRQYDLPMPEYGNHGPTPHRHTPLNYPSEGSSSMDQPPSRGTTSRQDSDSISNVPLPPNDPIGLSSLQSQYQSQAATSTSNNSNILPDNAFFNLFWPNWPASLPSPKLVYSLCDIFFSKKWLCEGIVNKERFFKGLACPPHHPAFPHVALLHAMCAVATKFVSPEAYGLDKETYWKSDASPTDYHAAAAKIHIDSAIIKGEKLLCVAQAIILVCFYSYTSARFVEVWLYCGLATRIASPLGLNHIESLIDEAQVFGPMQSENMFRKGPTPAACVPTSEEDKQEQAHTFWLAFTCDRLAAACTGWASSMPEDEVSTLLPKPTITPGSIQPITANELEQLSLSSPTFFTSNALPLVNAVNLQYKSVVLLGRVCSFLRSAPWPLGADIIKGARNYRAGLKQTISDIPNSPEFKKLDALIVAFRLSFPKEYKNVLKRDESGAVEIALVSAHVIPHAATILLHEAFCEQEEDVSMQRCLTSARAILSIIYLLWEVSYDVSMLQPFVTFCWAVAGRTLVRELAFKKEAQDELGEATLKQEISVILSAMRMFSQRNALGVVVTKALQSLLENPLECHPRHNGGRSLADGCGMSPATASHLASNTGSTVSSNAPSVPSTESAPTSHLAVPNDKFATDSPGQMFNNLLWELEQPGVQISENENYKKMEMDLRSLIGPSYDQLLNLSTSEITNITSVV